MSKLFKSVPLHDSKAKAFLALWGIVSVAWLSGWFTALLVTPPPSWPIRFRLFGIGFALAGGCAFLFVRHLAAAQQRALRHFQDLCGMDPQQLSRAAATGENKLEPTNPWFEIAQQFTDRFADNCERLERAEQSRSALEIRVRRSAARQAQVEAILAAFPEPVVATNQFDELVLANAAAERLFEFDEAAAAGQPLAKVLHCERLLDLLVETRRRRAPMQRSTEIEMAAADGTSHWFAAWARSFADDASASNGGQPQGAFAVLRDVDELKSAQKRYAEFVSSVSHEMKSPLAGIKAYVELLADGEADDPQTREEFLNVISSQANRLHRLIDNLLNLARIEAGVVEVSKNSISLNELLDEALDIVRPAADAKRIRLGSEFSSMYLGVLADRDMLMQVAINLLSNAIKYTPDEGRVTLRSHLADDEVQFAVDDSGVGLCEHDRLRVFEKFYRVQKDRTMASGTGLGLPLAKHIVEDVHGGRITVESTPGEGSVFTVSLPAAAQLVRS